MKKEETKLKGIGHLPESLKPYERMEANGAAALSDAELLSILITTGTREESAVEVGKNILASCRNGDLSHICDLSIEELMKIRGVGRVKAIRICATCEISRRIARNVPEGLKCSDSDVIGRVLTNEMGNFTREVFRVVILDRKLKMICMKDVFLGSVDCAPVHPREVFGEAVRHLGSYIIIAHNHPSGDPAPSRDDINVTERLMTAGKIMGIDVIDHIVVGCGRFYSMQQHGEIDRLRRKIERDISGRI